MKCFHVIVFFIAIENRLKAGQIFGKLTFAGLIKFKKKSQNDHLCLILLELKYRNFKIQNDVHILCNLESINFIQRCQNLCFA